MEQTHARLSGTGVAIARARRRAQCRIPLSRGASSFSGSVGRLNTSVGDHADRTAIGEDLICAGSRRAHQDVALTPACRPRRSYYRDDRKKVIEVAEIGISDPDELSTIILSSWE
jgi:hypothetical protein